MAPPRRPFARTALLLVTLCGLAGFLRVGWRASFARAATTGTGLPPTLVLLDSESAYRLRLAELALATGSAPRLDRMVAPRAGTPVPWPPLGHLVPALLARRAEPAERELALARTAAWLPPLEAALGVLLVLAAARLAGAGSAAALAAALGFALLCPGGTPGDLSPAPFAGALAVVAAAALVRIVRVTDPADLASLGLFAGLASAAAVLLDLGALPLVLSGFAGALVCGAFGSARAGGADPPRASGQALGGLLAGLTALFATGLAAEAALPARQLYDPSAGPPILFALLSIGFAILWLGRRVSGGTVAAAALGVPVLLLAPGLAGLDLPRLGFSAELAEWLRQTAARGAGRAAPAWLAAGLVLAAAAAGRLGRPAVGALVLALAAAAPYWGPGTGRGEGAALAARAQEVAALRWMREGTPSAGAWNHPGALQSWCVSAPPERAGLVLFHARRPVAEAPWASTAPTLPARYALVLGNEPPPPGARVVEQRLDPGTGQPVASVLELAAGALPRAEPVLTPR